jgi:hypothetical protein
MKIHWDIVVFILLVIAMLFGLNFLYSKECSGFKKKTGVETQYDFVNGCLVQLDNNKWVKLDNYQSVIIEQNI